jgi:hypothetical protein
MNPATVKVVLVIIAVVISSVGHLRHPVIVATKHAGAKVAHIVKHPKKVVSGQ